MNSKLRLAAAVAVSALLLACSSGSAQAEDSKDCGMAYNPCYTNRSQPHEAIPDYTGWTVSDVVLDDGRRVRCITLTTSSYGLSISCDWGAK